MANRIRSCTAWFSICQKWRRSPESKWSCRRLAVGSKLSPETFSKTILPEADLYALGRILHDWSEDKIDLLLRKVLARLPAGGVLLLAEKLLNEGGVGPAPANM